MTVVLCMFMTVSTYVLNKQEKKFTLLMTFHGKGKRREAHGSHRTSVKLRFGRIGLFVRTVSNGDPGLFVTMDADC